MIDQEKVYEALCQGSMDKIKELTQKALNAGDAPERILKEGLIPAMDQIGVRFRNNEIFIPEVLIAARAMHAGLGVLKPILAKSTTSTTTKVVIGTVKGDLHDIGKNLVGMMLEGAGFEVVDLGIDVSPEKFIQSAKENGAKIIGMSALLTTTMMQMQTTVQKIKAEGLKVKTVIGGAPVTAEFAKQIGADGYAPDAASAVSTIKEVLN
ncbi:MAG: trimethylamine corrinoid protein 2 [Deltaproteobacteria bacterium]|jgi:5-methyltetrahydrofolate--homocysteine methyltransferase|nr:trimethylamine corrinoid protein 2 [Deltaproteobacteria bacterium]